MEENEDKKEAIEKLKYYAGENIKKIKIKELREVIKL